GDLDALLAAPVGAVLDAQVAVDPRATAAARPPEGARVGLLTYQPVVDGTVLPRPPLDAVRAGSAAGVPLVAGSTAAEWNLFHLQSRMKGPLDEEGGRRPAAAGRRRRRPGRRGVGRLPAGPSGGGPRRHRVRGHDRRGVPDPRRAAGRGPAGPRAAGVDVPLRLRLARPRRLPRH